MPQEKVHTHHLAVGLALLLTGAAQAQDAPTAKQAAPAVDPRTLRDGSPSDIELDIPGLLAGVRESEIKDAVWRPSPKPLDAKTGRKEEVLVVPMRVVGMGFKVSSPPITPESGRFVAWYIPAPVKADKADKAGTPAGAPRFAAGFWVDNDRQIHWSVDRFTSTMAMDAGSALGSDQTLYLFAMDRQRLLKQRPAPLKPPGPYQRPERVKGEPIAVYKEREAAARKAHFDRVAAERQTHADKVAQYAKVQDQVASLPYQFSEPRPTMVYAVYYVTVKVKTGPYAPVRDEETVYTGFPQGKWVVPGDAWDSLKFLAAGSGAAPVAAAHDAAVEKLKSIKDQVASKHPAALQAASVAMVNSGLLHNLALDGLPFALANQIIGGGDVAARQNLVKGLVSANISSGKAELLKRAVMATAGAGEEVGDSDLSVASLRVLLRAKETATDARRATVTLAAMDDPHGPSPKAALGELLDLLEGKQPADGPLTFERAHTLAKHFKVSQIRDDVRRKAAMAAVMAASAKSPLAAVLVDEALFVAPRQSLLEALAVMAAPPQAQAEAQAGKRPDAWVPLFSDKHHVLDLLASEDDVVRLAAWQALPAAMVQPIVFKDEKPDPAAKGALVDTTPLIIGQVVKTGLADKDTPLALLDFLEDHATRTGTDSAALAGLMQVLADGDAAANSKAMALLARPEFEKLFVNIGLALAPEMRWKVVTRSYAAKRMSAPDVTGLLLESKVSDDIFRWFGGQFAQGQLPMAARYADQVKPEVKLLDLVLSQDPRLAKGAVAVLAYREGADDAQVAATVTQMLSKPYKLRAQMEREWEECRNNLFLNRIKALEGDRLVRLAVINKDDKAWRGMDVGLVSLQWKKDEGLSLGVPRMALQPDAEKKALVLSEASLIDRINSKARRALDVTSLSGPVPFTWHPPCWEAQMPTEDGQIALIQIAPVGWKKFPDVPVFEAKKEDAK